MAKVKPLKKLQQNKETEVDQKTFYTIKTYFNYIQFYGWSLILIYTLFYALQSQLNEKQHFFSQKFLKMNLIWLIRVFQGLQILEFFLEGNFFSSFPQQLSRQIIVWLLFGRFNFRERFLVIIVFAYSLAEQIRFNYYLNKKSHFAGILRYNGFLILYPLGVTGEMFVYQKIFVTDFQQFDVKNQTYSIIWGRFCQIATVIGMIVLYSYLLKQRQKYYKRKYA